MVASQGFLKHAVSENIIAGPAMLRRGRDRLRPRPRPVARPAIIDCTDRPGDKINIELTNRRETHLLNVQNGVPVHEANLGDPAASATVRLRWPDLLGTLLEHAAINRLVQAGAIRIEGDASLNPALAAMVQPLAANFAIVTP